MLGVLGASGAFVLGRIAPDYEAIMMLGPYQSGKVRVILWAVAIVMLILAALTAATMLGSRHDTTLSKVTLFLTWVAAVLLLGFVLLVTALRYDQQPETHKFTVGGQDYILTSQIGFLIAADDTYLYLYRKEGRVYRDVELQLTVADTVTFNRDGFSLDRGGASTWLVYVSGSDESVRVQIP